MGFTASKTNFLGGNIMVNSKNLRRTFYIFGGLILVICMLFGSLNLDEILCIIVGCVIGTCYLYKRIKKRRNQDKNYRRFQARFRNLKESFEKWKTFCDNNEVNPNLIKANANILLTLIEESSQVKLLRLKQRKKLELMSIEVKEIKEEVEKVIGK